MTSEREDDLRNRYLEASAQDPRRPAPQVRAAVLAHARMVLQAQSRPAAAALLSPGQSANQDRWKVRALSSVVVLGLAALLELQFDRGTPQEKDLVAGLPAITVPAPDNTSAPVAALLPSTAETAGTTVGAPTAAGRGAATGTPLATGKGERTDTTITTTGDASTAPQATVSLEATAPAAAAAAANPPPAPMAKAAPEGPAVAAAPAAALSRAQQNAVASVSPPANPPSTGPLAPMAPSAAMRSRLANPDGLAAAQALPNAARLGQLEVVNRLLVPGAPIDVPDANGQTPLMLAAMNGHLEVVRRLVAAGAGRALRDSDGLTAADHARRAAHTEILRLLEATP